MDENNAVVQEIEHSAKFEIIKEYFDSGRWKKKAVRNAVTANPPWKITPAEYELITGEIYT